MVIAETSQSERDKVFDLAKSTILSVLFITSVAGICSSSPNHLISFVMETQLHSQESIMFCSHKLGIPFYS